MVNNYETFIDNQVKEIQILVKKDKVLLALSGGVDSSVVAALLHKAIGDQLVCVFVDHGLLRKDEVKQVENLFVKTFNINLITIDAKDRFLNKLKNIIDPEEKRKVIGNEFIYIFEEEANKQKDVKCLAQGTILADIIESGKDKKNVIKSHHNVGGLPERLGLILVEPLKTLYKDDVRNVGKALGLPDEIILRQPFPGPGLAVRILGEVNEESLLIVRESDAILREEIAKHHLDQTIWQYFTVLTPLKTVGIRDDVRTYHHVIAIRAVYQSNGMIASVYPLDYSLLDIIVKRIIHEVHGVGRVVYDVTPKPPGTIEWE